MARWFLSLGPSKDILHESLVRFNIKVSFRRFNIKVSLRRFNIKVSFRRYLASSLSKATSCHTSETNTSIFGVDASIGHHSWLFSISNTVWIHIKMVAGGTFYIATRVSHVGKWIWIYLIHSWWGFNIIDFTLPPTTHSPPLEGTIGNIN